MGRHYNGDISGKFWFAVQSSDAPERFGATEFQPTHLNYYLDDLDEVERELNDIHKNMQGNIERLDDFFKENNGYNYGMIIDWYKEKYNETICEEEARDMISEYADYELGQKIAECIKEQGDCNINAEI